MSYSIMFNASMTINQKIPFLLRYGFKIDEQKHVNNHIILHHRVVHQHHRYHLFVYHRKHFQQIQHHLHHFIKCLMDEQMHQLHLQRVL
jgi:hypothetical protein